MQWHQDTNSILGFKKSEWTLHLGKAFDQWARTAQNLIQIFMYLSFLEKVMGSLAFNDAGANQHQMLTKVYSSLNTYQ